MVLGFDPFGERVVLFDELFVETFYFPLHFDFVEDLAVSFDDGDVFGGVLVVQVLDQ